MAQSLVAAQATIPQPSSTANGKKTASFLIHSMHCYFLLPGVSMVPIIYHVERVREGRSFMTRTVQARQRGKCIFTTTCSFTREEEDDHADHEEEGEEEKEKEVRKTLDHEWEIPEGAIAGLDEMLKKDVDVDVDDAALVSRAPCISKPLRAFPDCTFICVSFFLVFLAPSKIDTLNDDPILSLFGITS